MRRINFQALLGATVIAVSALAASSCATDTIVNSAANTVSAIGKATESITPEQEYYIGRAVAGTILENYKVYNNAVTQTYLNKICHAIAVNSDRPELYKGYYVAILDSDEVNALSTSGGHILVTRGLLDCALSEDALAAVIAHELAHIHLQHSIKAIKSSRATEAIKSTAGTVALAVTSGSETTVELVSAFDETVGDVVSQLVTSGYSQSQEFDADKYALQLMAQAGYKPEAMQDMLTVLNSKSTSSSSGFGKTHPTPQKRLDNLNKEYGKYSVADTTAARTARFQNNRLK